MTTIQSEDPNESVNHPRHYNQHPSDVETIELIENLSCNFSNAVKYIWRCGLKTSVTPLRDLEAARWYTERESRRVDLYELYDGPIPKTDVIWRAMARLVIEKDGDTVLGRYLTALLGGEFDEMLYVIDEAIGRVQYGARGKP